MSKRTMGKRILGRRAGACALALFFTSMSGCGVAVDGAEELDVENFGETQQALVANGYWQVAGGPAVYWLHGSSMCWVRDQGMLMAMRWTTTPQWTNSNYTLAQLRSGRFDEGACHYPDFVMLKTYDSRWVYKMTVGGFCHVKDLDQLARFGGWSKVLIMQRERQRADYSEGGGVGAEGVWLSAGARIYTGDCREPQEP